MRFDLERLLIDAAPSAMAAVTAPELLIGVERADSPHRRVRRETFVENLLDRISIVPFDLPQARLLAVHFADLARRGQKIGDRDLQIAVTALSLNYDLATLNRDEFRRVFLRYQVELGDRSPNRNRDGTAPVLPTYRTARDVR
jgi:predicted nucleic acid-binding protein